MSRIRSLHPGQWTDPEFVSCTPLARLFAIAIRNECDDNGIFEWKPLMLKMRCLPADNCDPAQLLKELVDTGQVVMFSSEGNQFGIVRNFLRYQRPKKPLSKYPVPGLLRDWYPTCSELVRNWYGKPHSEEGGRMKEGGSKSPSGKPAGASGATEHDAWDAAMDF